ncbi:hypothetical protein AB3Z07_21295 [Metabacillus halosaccharovorans]|uniref:hypothetical protein n=1 Tax=Metabacillus halosaccharovorans TaxID=930124 RepID=UPI0034CFE6BA
MFYTGQKVKITDNTCRHRLKIGSIVTLSHAEEVEDGSWDLYAEGEKWVFDQDDCVPTEE